MTNLFIVDTPLHLLNTLTLIKDRYERDLNEVILTMKDYNKWLQVIETASVDCRIIHTIQVTKETGRITKFLRLASTALNVWHPKQRLFLSNLDTPDRIVEFSPSIITLLCKSAFPQASNVLAEDGSGSYNGEILRVKYSFSRFSLYPEQRRGLIWFFSHIICKDSLNNVPDMLLVHDRTWLTFEPSFPVKEFSRQEVSQYYECLNTETDLYYGDYNVIVLGEPSHELSCELDVLEAKAVSEARLDAVYRPHPRQINNTSAFNNVDPNPRDWELRCGTEIFDNHVLLGIGSSAMMSPCLLYGLQPYLIFTYLLHEKLGLHFQETMSEIVEEVRGKYSDSTKIMVPKTYDELLFELNSISSSLRERGRNV